MSAAPLEGLDLTELQRTLQAAGLDGWLLYEFHGANPVAVRLLGVEGIATRRLFVWLPAKGRPVAVAHRIELQGMAGFPGEVRPYAAWQELRQHLAGLVRGRRIAMEYSPEDGVPYLDRVPAGVLELIRALGGEVVGSEGLVTRFAARWSSAELADHRIAAEGLAEIAQQTMREVVRQPGVTEFQVQRLVLERMARVGLSWPWAPIVGFAANAANPHYEPREGDSATLQAGQVVLIDLFGARSSHTVPADQTWMGFAGPTPPAEVQKVWATVRDARDAVVSHLKSRWSTRATVTGAELDGVARRLITDRGYGDAFLHRTGHSIDREIHGCGPHLDGFETNDTRELMTGVGFSVEPGVYLTGNFGVRSEINLVITESGPEVTPTIPQRDLILAS